MESPRKDDAIALAQGDAGVGRRDGGGVEKNGNETQGRARSNHGALLLGVDGDRVKIPDRWGKDQ